MIVGEPNQTYEKTKGTIWRSHESFMEAFRLMDNQALPKEWCENLMTQITGSKGDGGEVVKALIDPMRLQEYVTFFPFFKTLSKMVYLAMT